MTTTAKIEWSNDTPANNLLIPSLIKDAMGLAESGDPDEVKAAKYAENYFVKTLLEAFECGSDPFTMGEAAEIIGAFYDGYLAALGKVTFMDVLEGK